MRPAATFEHAERGETHRRAVAGLIDHQPHDELGPLARPPLLGQSVPTIGAREYGIPYVANIDAATGLLRNGDVVHLDGSSGTVLRLGRSADTAREAR
jgi:hypothetical protein